MVLKVGKYHSIFLSLREVFFGSISIIAHTQLDVGYFEAEACFFFKRHNKVVFMTDWEWVVKKGEGCLPLSFRWGFSGWIWDMA